MFRYRYTILSCFFLFFVLGVKAQPILLQAYGSEIAEANDWVYFVADDATTGMELWKTDGTTTGTMLVSDLTPGGGDSDIRELTSTGGLVFFVHRANGSDADQLWRSDGTAGGTILLSAFPSGTELAGLTAVNGKLMFFVTGLGGQVWKSDGTAAGTVYITDNDKNWKIEPILFNDYRPGIFANGDDLFFLAEDWFYDENLDPEPYNSYDRLALFHVNVNGSAADYLMNFHWAQYLKAFYSFFGETYFILGSGDFGILSEGLWKTDGTAAGTALVPLGPDGVDDPIITQALEYNGWIYLRILDSDWTPTHGALWKTDGTAGGAVLLKTLNETINDNWEIGDMGVYDNHIYFGAEDEATGVGAELWRTDGTNGGTDLFKDVWPGPAPNHSQPLRFFSAGDYLYFTAIDDVHGRELWKTDGTTGGTMLLKDITPGTGGSFSYIDFGTQYDLKSWEISGKAFFLAGTGLWMTDGTTDGTQLIKSGTINEDEVLVADGKIFFPVNTASGRELWVYTPSSDDFYIRDYTLVNAATDQDIQTLNDGDVITINSFFSNDYNVRANTVPEIVGSVSFFINDYFIRTESRAPYAVGGDNPVGDYWSYPIFPGVFTLKGIPYSEANGGGTAGPEKSITVTVVYNGWSWSWKEGVSEEHLRMYPNPVQDKLVLELFAMEPGTVRVNVFDQTGRAVIAERHEKAPGLWTHRMNMRDLPNGVYTLVAQWGEQRITKRLVKN